MQKNREWRSFLRPSFDVNGLCVPKDEDMYQDNAGSCRLACAFTSWVMSKGSRVGYTLDRRQLAVGKGLSRGRNGIIHG